LQKNMNIGKKEGQILNLEEKDERPTSNVQRRPLNERMKSNFGKRRSSKLKAYKLKAKSLKA
jgi:hypothetical protein